MMANSSYRCPQCGYEYESWVEICPDCKVPVQKVEDAPPVEHNNPALGVGDDPKWTVAANVPNAIIGSLIKSQLEDAGIPVLMTRSRSADIAEFSHNDYVPQDIRVPAHLREQARQLVYATPESLSHLNEFYTDDDEPDENATPYKSSLPEGWSLLPGETEMRERRELIAGRGETPAGWYWSDEHQQASVEYEQEEPVIDWRSQQGHMARGRPNAHETFREEAWPKQPKWIRILYGIMLLAITLPFLLQLLEQLARLFNR
ncbi:MAG TPA: hypothetical protein VJ183_04495 [Chloroflexia bacterium]|nr:hypothetical protein [Chloroflexia bacterium]